jgi:hypothetical protein
MDLPWEAAAEELAEYLAPRYRDWVQEASAGMPAAFFATGELAGGDKSDEHHGNRMAHAAQIEAMSELHLLRGALADLDRQADSVTAAWLTARGYMPPEADQIAARAWELLRAHPVSEPDGPTP